MKDFDYENIMLYRRYATLMGISFAQFVAFHIDRCTSDGWDQKLYSVY